MKARISGSVTLYFNQVINLSDDRYNDLLKKFSDKENPTIGHELLELINMKGIEPADHEIDFFGEN